MLLSERLIRRCRCSGHHELRGRASVVGGMGRVEAVAPSALSVAGAGREVYETLPRHESESLPQPSDDGVSSETEFMSPRDWVIVTRSP